jgi:hypothetical protein
MNTNKHKNKNSDSIIELLRKDYLSKNANNLANKKGEIVQDHISRGLYNSTVCLNEQLGTHYDHIDSLIDYIIESLKNDFPNIPLGQCKDRLLAIIDEEYRKLIPFTNSFLVNAGLASQGNLVGFEKGVNGKKEGVKQAVETKIAIIEEQRKAIAETVKKKPWYKKAWPYISGFVLLLAAIFAIAWYALDLKDRFFPRQ